MAQDINTQETAQQPKPNGWVRFYEALRDMPGRIMSFAAKHSIRVLGFLMMFMISPFWAAVMAGYFAVRLGARLGAKVFPNRQARRERRAAKRYMRKTRRARRKAAKAERKAKRKEGRKAYRKWNRKAFIAGAGIAALIAVRKTRLGSQFAFLVKDPETYKRVSEAAKRFAGRARTWVDWRGRYRVSADDEKIAQELAEVAYPSREVTLTNRSVMQRQYIVKGAESQEMAEKMIAKMQAENRLPLPDASMMEVGMSVDGQPIQTLRTGGAVPSVGEGEFLVIVRQPVEEASTKIRMPLNAQTPDEMLLHVQALQADGAITFPKEVATTPQEAYLKYAKTEVGNAFDKAVGTSQKMQHPTRPDVYYVCKDHKALSDIVASGRLPKGAQVHVGQAPKVEPGQMLLSVKADALPPGFAYEALAEGKGSVAVPDDVSINGLRHSWLNLADAKERMGSANLRQLNSRDLYRWVQDASQIQSVNVTLDKKSGMMSVRTVVDGVEKIEARKLNARQAKALEARLKVGGTIPEGEMRDLVLQMHPDFFKSYPSSGKGFIPDPMGDFALGRSPRTAQDVLVAREARLRRQQQQQLAPQNRPRTPLMKA